jgi:hypothetical protein
MTTVHNLQDRELAKVDGDTIQTPRPLQPRPSSSSSSMVPSLRATGLGIPLSLSALVLLSGCAGAYLAGGPSIDSGTYDVTGVKTGTGVQVELGFQSKEDGTGAGGYLSSGLMGYSSPGDGDPIYQTLLEFRYRGFLGDPTRRIRPFYALGLGSGVFFVAGPRGGALTLHGELGLELGRGSRAVTLSIRERPALYESGSRDFMNSVQIFLGLGF